jgi:cardiolipin synthase
MMNTYNYAKAAKLIFSGSDYFEKLDAVIENAKDCIHLQTYIFNLDETGIAVLNSLKKAAQRGVKIFVLADAYGSKAITRKDIRKINADGIHFRLFSPLFSSESIYPGRRLHHKIAVIDRHTALIGGINIADKYRGTSAEPAWLDYGVMIEGAICTQLHTICEEFYERKQQQDIRKEITKTEGENIPVRFNQNDWIKGKNEIHKSYFQALRNSKTSIIFIASYFLPGYRFRKALTKAKKRGVDVCIVLAGKSDMPFLWYAEKYFYPFFLQNGIRIFEWKNSIMHAKAVIVDNDWVTIGSYNLNPVSHYLSIELNAEIKDRQFTAEFRKHITEIIDQACLEVTLKQNPYSLSWLARTRNSILYYFFKFIFLIFISKKR